MNTLIDHVEIDPLDQIRTAIQLRELPSDQSLLMVLRSLLRPREAAQDDIEAERRSLEAEMIVEFHEIMALDGKPVAVSEPKRPSYSCWFNSTVAAIDNKQGNRKGRSGE